jgi:excisionase family DNA binding protein
MQEKEYMTYAEAIEMLGVGRSTLHTMIADFKIPSHKFRYDKRHYLALADVKRLKQIREAPWTAGEKAQEERIT